MLARRLAASPTAARLFAVCVGALLIYTNREPLGASILHIIQMRTITIKRASFMSSNYSVFVDGKGPAYSATLRFTWHDPQEIVLHAPSKRSDEIIHMKPVGAADKKTGYGERAEYSFRTGAGSRLDSWKFRGESTPSSGCWTRSVRS